MENLAKALAAFQKDLPKVGKDKTAKMGTYSYSYTDLATLTHTVVPVLVKHGLTFVTYPRATESGYELVGRLMHTSGEFLEGALPIYGRQPQEIGSAVSYARRYILGCLTGVVSESDDDGKAAVKASRTQSEPARDWQVVADTAEMMTNVDDVKNLWTKEEVSKAPRAIQERIKLYVENLKAESDA